MAASSSPQEGGYDQVISVMDWADELLQLDNESRADALEQMRPYLSPHAYEILFCTIMLEGGEDSVDEESSAMAWAKRLLSLGDNENATNVLKQLDSFLTPYDKEVIICMLDQIAANNEREDVDTTNALLNVAVFNANLELPFIGEEDNE